MQNMATSTDAHAPKLSHCAGFSLIYVAVTLVVIALLTGGFFVGKTMLHAANLRSVASQYEGYVTAVKTFQVKYKALPGDMPNAIGYWGSAGTYGNCATSASSSSLTCNGDGDGQIDVSADSNESFRFWQQLKNEGLISGHYDGISHGIAPYSANTYNSPKGPLKDSLWFTLYYGEVTSQTSLFDGSYGNIFELGGHAVNDEPSVPILTPLEAYNIDNKIDDGKPASGKLVTRTQNGFSTCTDATVSNPTTASYQLAIPTVTCSLIFRQAFGPASAATAAPSK